MGIDDLERIEALCLLYRHDNIEFTYMVQDEEIENQVVVYSPSGRKRTRCENQDVDRWMEKVVGGEISWENAECVPW